jgi:hypothetical protein
VDLEIYLPMMDERNHPSMAMYTKKHTRDCAPISRGDAFQEWSNKAAGIVFYLGISLCTQ